MYAAHAEFPHPPGSRRRNHAGLVPPTCLQSARGYPQPFRLYHTRWPLLEDSAARRVFQIRLKMPPNGLDDTQSSPILMGTDVRRTPQASHQARYRGPRALIYS